MSKLSAQLYHARRRRKALFDPASGLFRTHVFTTADTDIDTAAIFGDSDSRTLPITFAFSLLRTGTGDGIVLEFGSDARGLAVWVDGADLNVAAGAGTVSADDGITLNAADALPLATSATGTLTLTDIPSDGETVSINGRAYTFQDVLTDVDGNVLIAFSTLTLTGNALDTETVTIDGKTYTFQDTLTDVDGNVQIGASASDSLDNLIAAINLDAGAGTLYADSMTAHPTVTASVAAGDAMTIADQVAGSNAALSVSDTLTDGGWIDAIEGTLDNLIAAINLDAGSGTIYAASTTANDDVSAAAGSGYTMDITALIPGDGASSVLLAETVSAGQWNFPALRGGSPASRFVVSVNPGVGTVELYRNGLLIGKEIAVNGDFGGAWADTDNGAIGDIQNTANDRVPGGNQIPLANVDIIGGVSVYLHQRAGA